jgi:hypothetical protein
MKGSLSVDVFLRTQNPCIARVLPEISVIPDIENGPDFLPIGSCKPSKQAKTGRSLDERSLISAGI